MKSAGKLLLAVAMVAICTLMVADAGSAVGQTQKERKPRVLTDGRLRPGHLEVIGLAGFPGRGMTEISFFPTAICEDGCGARSWRGGETNAKGVARFWVRVPGTFFNRHERPTYFRDRERIDVNVTWEGADGTFAVASAEPEPILVRTHGSPRG